MCIRDREADALQLHHAEHAARDRIIGHARALEPHRRRADRSRDALAVEVRDPDLATRGRIAGLAAELVVRDHLLVARGAALDRADRVCLLYTSDAADER